jgi:lipoprotein-anchoring transpeptidase ErfK/SrfK
VRALRIRLGLASRRVLIVAVTAAAVVVAGGVAATARVQSASDRILMGVGIDGVDVGGMTRAQAVAAVQRHAAPALSSRVTVVARGRRWLVTPSGLGRWPQTGQAVDRALDGPPLSWLLGIWHRVSGRPVRQQVPLNYTRNARQVASFVDTAASRVDVAPVDASLALVDGKVRLRHARTGLRLDQPAGRRLVAAALRGGHPATVRLPVRTLPPDRPDAAAGTTITVDLSTNTLRLYQRLEPVKTYPVATARAGFTTPTGTWQVVTKLVDPSWHNPAPDGWGAGMPLVIPPGPGNPLGTRALALNAPGILIHGSYAAGSIGGYASHGCIRMQIWDAEDLYPRVPVGARVLVYRS